MFGDDEQSRVTYLPGIGFGIAVGIGAGLVMDSVFIGLGVGIAIGVVFRAAARRHNKQ